MKLKTLASLSLIALVALLGLPHVPKPSARFTLSMEWMGAVQPRV